MTEPKPPTGAAFSAADAARAVLAAVDRGEGVVVALALEGPAAGRRRVVATSRSEGSLGGSRFEAAVDRVAREMLAGTADPGPRGRDAGVRDVPADEQGPEVPVYFERTRPVPGLLIVGAGHLAGPLHRLGAILGHRVTVADDRPDFARVERFPEAERVVRVDFTDPFREIPPRARTHVLLVTRGHRYDFECLRRLLREEPPPVYVGMIGSRRRVRATFHQLREEGVRHELLSRIHAPVGLDLGAETPEEIAVAVAAEWVLLARGGTGRPLVEVERIAERFFGGEERGGKDLDGEAS